MTMKNDVCGIYMIENKNTGQRYIGQSIHIYQRWHQHINRPQMSMHIDRAIKKHGADNFDLKVICELEQDNDLLNEMEKYYVWKYNTYEDNFHYNLTPGGDFNPMKVSEIAAKRSGENHPMYGKKGEENPLYGRKHTPKTKAKMSKAKFGKKLSGETRKKMSEAKNTTGYYRVHKEQNHRYKQGFRYVYQYYENSKQHYISSVSLEKLEQKVKAKNLEWFKLDNNNGE